MLLQYGDLTVYCQVQYAGSVPGFAARMTAIGSICHWNYGSLPVGISPSRQRCTRRGLPIPVEKNPARPLADYERYQKLLEVADQVQMRIPGGKRVRSYLLELLVLAEGTGRRIGAIVALRFSDWDPDAEPFGALRWRADSDKLGKEWSAPVTPEVKEAIERIRRERPGVGDAWLFPAPKNPTNQISVWVVSRWLKEAEVLAKVPHLPGGGWHMFRRMWATARKDMSLKDVAAAGGWKDTATLQRCYQHPDPETLAQVVWGARQFRLAN